MATIIQPADSNVSINPFAGNNDTYILKQNLTVASNNIVLNSGFIGTLDIAGDVIGAFVGIKY